VQAFARMIGPDRDIPAPDVYTNAMILGWMADEYASIVGETVPAVITGKPLSMGGSLGRDTATGDGAWHCIRTLLPELLPDTESATVAIQGFGNAGQFMARLAAADGHIVTAVSDSRGAVGAAGGLPVDRLLKVKAAGGAVSELAGTDGVCAIPPEDVIATECDLLVPAAMENMIDGGNAGRISARAILELATGPVTPEGDAVLAKRGVTVLPDILANAGGVTVSYFEWVQNRQGYYWPLEEIHSRLKTIMEREGEAIWEIARERSVSVRTAAYMHALSRLTAAIEAHGTQKFFTG
jgi:glutamate dehydrogenase (NADP+)